MSCRDELGLGIKTTVGKLHFLTVDALCDEAWGKVRDLARSLDSVADANLTRLQRSLVAVRLLTPPNEAFVTPLSQTSLLP